ncbi:L-ribulose-5-phosphate 3-epimerase [Treponema primitia]|uniref:L-ribulose-5-phosphate 3-epimerase n=1 Tax=Treponema primitia TaxID=88058 RepID=UPI00025555D4|nr:L-ribulose-5-phosphate 3-epimerase [Treponema primitia]
MKPYQIGIYEKAMPKELSWKEKLQTAKSFGYDFLEISIDETDEKLARLKMSAAERLELLSQGCEIGLPIRTMCLSGHRKYPLGSEKAAVRMRSLEIMEDAINFACDTGIRIIQLAGYDVYYDSSTPRTEELFYDGLLQSVQMAAARGVILAFETMETEFMNTVEKAMQYVKRIDSPYLKVYPDCGNLTNAAESYGKDVIEDLRKGRGSIAALHLKETVPGKFREIPYGTGHVNFASIIKTALELNVRTFVTEFWYTGEADFRETIKTSKSFIDRQFTN